MSSSDPIGILTLKSIGKTLAALSKIILKNMSQLFMTLLDSPTTMTQLCIAPGGGLQELVHQPWKH